jgi:hypothetical protein
MQMMVEILRTKTIEHMCDIEAISVEGPGIVGRAWLYDIERTMLFHGRERCDGKCQLNLDSIAARGNYDVHWSTIVYVPKHEESAKDKEPTPKEPVTDKEPAKSNAMREKYAKLKASHRELVEALRAEQAKGAAASELGALVAEEKRLAVRKAEAQQKLDDLTAKVISARATLTRAELVEASGDTDGELSDDENR